MLEITLHAIERYQQRVEACDANKAYAALSSPIVERAAQFGCPYVRLPTGQRIVIQGGVIVTVLPKDHRKGKMGRDSDQRRLGGVGRDGAVFAPCGPENGNLEVFDE